MHKFKIGYCEMSPTMRRATIRATGYLKGCVVGTLTIQDAENITQEELDAVLRSYCMANSVHPENFYIKLE